MHIVQVTNFLKPLNYKLKRVQMSSHYTPRISRQGCRAELQRFLGKQRAQFLGRPVTDHPSTMPLHASWHYLTCQFYHPQVPKSKVSWSADRYRRGRCLASTVTGHNPLIWKSEILSGFETVANTPGICNFFFRLAMRRRAGGLCLRLGRQRKFLL